MNDRADGIILKEMDYREHDVMITVLSEQYGKIAFTVSGARKMSSRNKASVLPYTKAEFEFDYKPRRTLFHLKRARTLKLYRPLHEDLTLSSAAAVLIGTADALTLSGEEDDDPKAKLSLLEKALDLLTEKEPCDLVIACYLSEMMQLFGVGAEVDACVHCGKPEAVVFSSDEGGFLCHECAGSQEPMTKEELMRMRRIVRGGITHYSQVRQLVTPSPQDAFLLHEMLVRHAGIRIGAYQLYRKLNRYA